MSFLTQFVPSCHQLETFPASPVANRTGRLGWRDRGQPHPDLLTVMLVCLLLESTAFSDWADGQKQGRSGTVISLLRAQQLLESSSQLTDVTHSGPRQLLVGSQKLGRQARGAEQDRRHPCSCAPLSTIQKQVVAGFALKPIACWPCPEWTSVL